MSGSSCLLRALCVWAMVVGVCGSATAIHFPATWDGGGDGKNYCDGVNWDIDIVPANQGPLTFDAIIGASKTVDFDGCGAGTGGQVAVNNFTLGANSTFKLWYVESWFIDFQGQGGTTGAQLPVPLTENRKRCNPTWGCTYWNAFNVPGEGLAPAANPSIVLKTSYGVNTPVTFSIVGNVCGYSNEGTDALLQDYLLVNGGGSDEILAWEISGLLPGARYHLSPLSSATNNITMLIDTDGDGSLDDESPKIVGASCTNTDVYASAIGTIIGVTSKGSKDVGHWASLQITQAGDEFKRWPATYRVLNDALISGRIEADRAKFEAVGPSAQFVGNKATLKANLGGIIRIAAPEYSSRDLGAATLFESDGPHSLLDLRSLATIDASFDHPGSSWNTQRIVARNGGVIDLSGLEYITGPRHYENLYIESRSGGHLAEFSSLKTVKESSLGWQIFDAYDGTEMSLPALETMENTLLRAYGGSEIKVTGENPVLCNTRKMHPTDFLVADGPGSRLLLTSIKELDASFDHPGSNWNYQRILAQNGG
ncbi:MAG: hypothetical protein IH624_16450, partial [Phycisphaerae bacterium]|nr:hypothetical protein [Phycisphaerae bacterium]